MRLFALAAAFSLTACAGQAQDLSTIGGFLEAFQSAATAGDADGLLALAHDGEGPAGGTRFSRQFADSVATSIEWRDQVLATTVEDMDWGGGTYWITLWQYAEVHDDVEYESNVSCEVTLVEDEYRINQCLAAG